MGFETLTPEGVSAGVAALVIVASFFTAALTAAFGLGGGLALIAIMSAVFPAAAVVPVHGVAQLGANASRLGFQRISVVWPILLWFSIGAVVGAAFGGKVALSMPTWVLQAGVGAFVLYSVWGPRPAGLKPGPATFIGTGVVGSFLTMFFGATGPIVAAMLGASQLDRLKVVATHAACMVVQHGLKIIIFGLLGFAYGDWALLIASIVAAGFLGSFAGTKMLHAMPEERFRKGFNTALTAVAFYLIASAALSLKTG